MNTTAGQVKRLLEIKFNKCFADYTVCRLTPIEQFDELYLCDEERVFGLVADDEELKYVKIKCGAKLIEVCVQKKPIEQNESASVHVDSGQSERKCKQFFSNFKET